MNLDKFNKQFGIKDSEATEQKRFVERINQSVFSWISRSPYPEDYETIFRKICYRAGVNAEDIIAMANRLDSYMGLHIPSLRVLTNEDFMETLKILALLYGSIDAKSIDYLDGAIESALSLATRDIGVRWKDGMFYPSG